MKYLVELRGWNGIALPAVHSRDAKIYIDDPGPWIMGLATEARYSVRPAPDVCCHFHKATREISPEAPLCFRGSLSSRLFCAQVRYSCRKFDASFSDFFAASSRKPSLLVVSDLYARFRQREARHLPLSLTRLSLQNGGIRLASFKPSMLFLQTG